MEVDPATRFDRVALGAGNRVLEMVAPSRPILSRSACTGGILTVVQAAKTASSARISEDSQLLLVPSEGPELGRAGRARRRGVCEVLRKLLSITAVATALTVGVSAGSASATNSAKHKAWMHNKICSTYSARITKKQNYAAKVTKNLSRDQSKLAQLQSAGQGSSPRAARLQKRINGMNQFSAKITQKENKLTTYCQSSL